MLPAFATGITPAASSPLWFAGPQNARGSGSLRLKLRYSSLVFGREIQQPFLGEGVGAFRETAAAFCLFFQSS
jgi:hypothetical protein